MPAGAAKTPIDLEHLDRQTLGDTEIRNEVLGIFLKQMQALRAELGASSGEARAVLAHQVKGAALGVGARSLAESAALLQENPGRADFAETLLRRAEEAAQFVAKLRKQGANWRS